MSASPQPASVLMVDDTPANLMALGAVLKPLGVRLVEAASGKEALARVAEESFAVVLLDAQMPEMDGFEVARRIRATDRGARVPIIFLTAIHREETYARLGYASGAADYMTKPYDVDVLRARVKAFVDLFHQREALRVEQVSARTKERDAALERLGTLLESEQAARRELEAANRAKDAFLATVSHELRTPLNAILGWTLLARRQVAGGPLERPLSIIERNANAQLRIIEDMLDFSRVLTGKLRLEVAPVEIAHPIAGAVEAVRLAADAKGVRLAVAVDESVGSVSGDADRLQQIVWNVLSNAIKFTPAGGCVELSAKRAGEHVIIRIADTGQGIRPAFLDHIFEPFRQEDSSTTRRHGGLGLGLSIVKQLVQAHGGQVSAYSEGEGKGSTFTIELPGRSQVAVVPERKSSPSPAPTEPASDPAAKLRGLRVLVVDDEEDARELIERMLAEQGADVVCAASAEQAIEMTRQMSPTVIVSDIAMPGIDGYGLLRALRSGSGSQKETLPAIALTAYATPQDVQRALSAGFQAHLAKPVDVDLLVAAVARLARQGPNGSPSPTFKLSEQLHVARRPP